MLQKHHSLLHSFVERLRIDPDGEMVAYCRQDETLGVESCVEYASRITAFLDLFESLQIKRGQKVICLCSQNEVLMPLYLACGFAGIVPVPFTRAFSLQMIQKLARECETRWILSEPHILEQMKDPEWNLISTSPMLAQPGLKGILPQRPRSGFSAKQILERLSQLLAAVKTDDLFLFQPTSGSTGVPKLIMRSHQNLVQHANHLESDLVALKEGLRDGKNQLRLMMTPGMTHPFGMHMTGAAVLAGASVTMPRKLDIQFLIDDFLTAKPHVLVAVPRVLNAIFQQLQKFPEGVDKAIEHFLKPHLQLYICAGGKPDESFVQKLKEHGIETITIYGCGEAALIAITPLGQRKPDIAGKVPSNVEIKLAPDSEILVRSPGLMLGYFNASEEQNQAAFSEDGYYRTGDIGELSKDGYLRVMGRKKDVFSTFTGYALHPGHIETKLETIPGTLQAILLGDRKPYVIALLILKESQPLPVSDFSEPLIRLHILDPNKSVEAYRHFSHYVDSINKQLEPFEKICKFALVNSFLEGKFYRTLKSGKLRLRRQDFNQHFAKEIEYLFSENYQSDVAPQKGKRSG